MLKKIFSIDSFKYLTAFLVPLIYIMMTNQSLDNDSWDVLAEGRYIVENGIYYTDVLSMHEGLNITVQNYGFAVVFWWVYSVFGLNGLYVGMLLLNVAICYLLYKICMLNSKKNVNLSLLIMVITDLVLALAFVTTRAQMIDYVLMLVLIYVLELYIKTDKTKYLWWIPLLSLLQVNLHASVWWILILVLGVYLVDGIRKPMLHLQGYRKKPLIIAGLAFFAIGFINPYGYKMITFIFTSYGDFRFHNLINELSSFSPFHSLLEALVFISMVGVMFLYIFGKKKNIRIRYLLMFFGFLALGMNTVKGLSQLILVMFFPIALLYQDVRLEKVIDAKIGRDALMFWCGVVSVCVFVGLSITLLSVMRLDDNKLVGAINAIDEDVGESNKRELKIYAGYGNGSYVEYRGYRPYIDPRGEVFLKKNNGKEDILYEWEDFINGKVQLEDFLKKYEFDYVLAEDEVDPFYSLEDDDYKLLYIDDSSKVKVFSRVK